MAKTFREWLDELDALVRELAPETPGPHSEITGADCWRPYYDDGYSPEEALREDWSYA